MGAHRGNPPSVTMTRPTDCLKRRPALSGDSGFTLVELMVASFVAALLSTLTFNILIDNTKSDVRSEFRRRLHENWNQATTLIQSEIAMSDLIESEGLSPNEVTAAGCDLLQDVEEARLKLRMHLVGTLPEIVYGVRSIDSLPEEEASNWMGGPEAGVLIRCGPRMNIGKNGRIEYTQGDYQQSIILDNIDLSKGDGLSINAENTSQKLVEFSLSMNENLSDATSTTIRTRTLSSGGVSRINEVPPIPNDVSVCETICQSEDVDCGPSVKTLLPVDPTFYTQDEQELVFGTYTICTNREYRLGAGMKGANRNYVMDGDPTPKRDDAKGVKLYGGIGRNILLGTPDDDILEGGSKHDALIGRGGNDTLIGNGGNDSILPWSSTSQERGSQVVVYGGEGFDRVYLKGEESAYVFSQPCNRTRCDLSLASDLNSAGDENKFKLSLDSVEQLIFKGSVKPLN